MGGDIVVDAELVGVGEDLQPMAPAVIEDPLVGAPDRKVVADVAGRDTFPGRQPADIGCAVGLFGRKEGEGGLGVTAVPDLLQRDDYPALEKDRQLVPKPFGKAFFGGDACFPEGVGRVDRLDKQVLFRHLLDRYRLPIPPEGPGGLHLFAPALHPAADQPQFFDLPVDDGQLLFKQGEAGVDVVALHMFLDFREGEADLLHNQDGVQVVQLGGAVIPVAVMGIDIGRAEEADFVVEDQGLFGNLLVAGDLADREQIFHENSP